MSTTTLHLQCGASDQEVFPVVEIRQDLYEDLRRLARKYSSADAASRTIGATGLVHEAWIKVCQTLGESSDARYTQRQYYGIIAQAMRRVLVDRARKKKSLRHGREFFQNEFSPNLAIVPQDSVDLIALNQAIDQLEKESAIHAEIVFLKYFADRSNSEIAVALDVSEAWVRRHWTYAKTRLRYLMECDLQQVESLK